MRHCSIVQLICKAETKWETAATLVFVCSIGHWNFHQKTKWLRCGLTHNILFIKDLITASRQLAR